MINRRDRIGWVLPLCLLLGVGVLGAFRESRAGGDITWAGSFEAGQRQARQTHRWMLLSFHTPGCGWCKKLDAETFTDPRVVDLSHRFVCVRLESDVDSALAERYWAHEFPMTLVTDENGKELARIPGYVPPEQFGPALQSLLDAGAKRR
jgi:thioredoxin-related protein